MIFADLFATEDRFRFFKMYTKENSYHLYKYFQEGQLIHLVKPVINENEMIKIKTGKTRN